MEITNSIIQEVKDELGISDDIPSTRLYDLLHKYRTTQHPDKFTDENLKEVAEEKFKKINSLLDKLSQYIELEKQQKPANELSIFQNDYEITDLKQSTVHLEKEIEKLKNEIKSNEYLIKRIRKENKRLKKDYVDKKTEELIKEYKPTKKSLLSLGIIFILTLITGVLTKVEEIANFIFKYSPFEESTLNFTIFSILILIPVFYGKMLFEQKQIKKASKLIKTPKLTKEFLDYLKEKELERDFNEYNVYEFLHSKFISQNRIVRFINSKIFHLYNDNTIDDLKDLFVYNLLNKKLIVFSEADKLDRNFRIVTKYSYPF
ncbi:hypothetical protein [Tenacibaculum sp.]|uniref:hypothetical protein n=1 Tax=Tenacibaculum sp. TaxID=1906242 RepID=UPI003AA830F4